MGMTLIIPEWWLIVIAVYLAIHAILSIRKVYLMKRELKLKKEIFEHEKTIHQYGDAIATAKRIASTPKHSRR
jgi:hypothetical protein